VNYNIKMAAIFEKKMLTHVANSSWLTGVWVGDTIKMAAIFIKNADSRGEFLVVDRCLGG
jgi:hypothetical protein